MSLKDEYFAMMTSQFRRWDARFGMLTEHPAPAVATADGGYDKQIKALRTDRELAYGKLQEIRTANESAWRGMQAGVDEAWISLKNALERVVTESGKLR